MLGADGALSHCCTFLIPRVIVAFDNRDELYKICADFVTQKPVDVQRVISIGCVYGRQDVERDPVFLQQPDAVHDAVKGWRTSLINAESIVEPLRAVQAGANQEIMLGEELAPRVIQRDRVCLERIVDLHAGLFVLLLITHGLSVEI